MLHNTTITFIEELAENNNKPWFDAHRNEYETARKDFESVVTGILTGLSETEALFKEQNAKDCIFRIFRDVRFSKDKTPYKAHFGAFFTNGGRKFRGGGYYLHIEPGGKSFSGGGLWMPEPALLKAVRQEVDYNFTEFSKIIEDKNFKKVFGQIKGEQLKTLPAGYKEDNPAIDFLKLKSFTVMHHHDDAELTSKAFIKKILGIFTEMQPFIDFLNRAAS
jgi:uncharacterized protein (TIGR02453 family)